MPKMNYFLIAFCLCPLWIFSQQRNPKEAFLEKWEHSATYLLEIIDLIPEEALNFKPTERQMSFEEQLIHIQKNMDWLGTVYFTAAADYDPSPIEKEKGMAPIHSKSNLRNRLKTAFDTLAHRVQKTPAEEMTETVDFFAGPKSKWQILNLLQDHVTHHRGQLIVYLNLMGIEPPKYIGW